MSAKLPPKEINHLFSYEGKETGRKYEGSFVFKRKLNIAEKYKLEQDKSRLLGGFSSPSNDLSAYAVLLSCLQNQIVDGPEWWKASRGSDLEDEDVLYELYDLIKNAEEEWKKEANPKKNEDLLGN
jgi:hypothetical protein